MKKNNKGFTLIELVMVIVILAILAAVAIPRFIDFKTDARLSAVKGIGGAISGAANILHSQYVLKGTTYMLGTTEGVTETTAVLNNANIAGATVDAGANITVGGASTLITITIDNTPYTLTYTHGSSTEGPKIKYNF